MNRRGSLFDIFIVLVLMLIIFVFFASWIFGFGLLTEQVTSLPNIQLIGGDINVSQTAVDTFGVINTGLSSLKWLALVITLSMFLSILVSNFLVKANPVFFIVYILIIVIAVVFSVYLSNAYESILTPDNALTTTLQSFTAMDYLMLNLPVFITIVGFAGAIFLFVGLITDKDSGGNIPI